MKFGLFQLSVVLSPVSCETVFHGILVEGLTLLWFWRERLIASAVSWQEMRKESSVTTVSSPYLLDLWLPMEGGFVEIFH